ncbi:hypothetical protein COO60DRAFT_30791 [Scenedesmus sp. NREL 46B-D3]|nr:hypothetical protein COO60DRAFT_30791 [Scenedesmus sp. NREL 46B-D3]
MALHSTVAASHKQHASHAAAKALAASSLASTGQRGSSITAGAGTVGGAAEGVCGRGAHCQAAVQQEQQRKSCRVGGKRRAPHLQEQRQPAGRGGPGGALHVTAAQGSSRRRVREAGIRQAAGGTAGRIEQGGGQQQRQPAPAGARREAPAEGARAAGARPGRQRLAGGAQPGWQLLRRCRAGGEPTTEELKAWLCGSSSRAAAAAVCGGTQPGWQLRVCGASRETRHACAAVAAAGAAAAVHVVEKYSCNLQAALY